MTDASDEQRIWRAPQRLTPDRVRSMQFSRTPVGRRGLSEEEVLELISYIKSLGEPQGETDAEQEG